MAGSTTADKAVQRSLSWKPRDVGIIIVSSLVFGLIYWLWGFPYTWLSKSGMNMALVSLINGVWFLGGLIPAAIIRKPGAMLIGQTLAALVEVTILPYAIDLGGGFGPEIYTNVYVNGDPVSVFNIVFMVGLIEGLGPEMVFGWFGYKAWSLKVFILAGAAGAVMEWFSGIWMTHYYLLDGSVTLWAILFTSIIAVACIAAPISWFIGEYFWSRYRWRLAEPTGDYYKQGPWRFIDLLGCIVAGSLGGAMIESGIIPIASVFENYAKSLAGVFYGGWIIAGLVCVTLVRRPGSMLFGQLMAAVAALFFFSMGEGETYSIYHTFELKQTLLKAWHPIFFLTLLTGIAAEVGLGIFRYSQKWVVKWTLTGALAAFCLWLCQYYITKETLFMTPIDRLLMLVVGSASMAVVSLIAGFFYNNSQQARHQ